MVIIRRKQELSKAVTRMGMMVIIMNKIISDAMLGDVIYEKEIDTGSLPRSGAGRLFNLSQFEDRLPDFKGIYHIVIRSIEDYWVKDSRFISLSDIGLIAKEGEDKIFVFANSIKTASAIDGVNISVYAANNQLIGTGATNEEGVAEIAYSKRDLCRFQTRHGNC